MKKVEIIKFKDVDLRGAKVIDGFSTVGLVGSIVANYLIYALKLIKSLHWTHQIFLPSR